jgi:hypothetical protein
VTGGSSPGARRAGRRWRAGDYAHDQGNAPRQQSLDGCGSGPVMRASCQVRCDLMFVEIDADAAAAKCFATVKDMPEPQHGYASAGSVTRRSAARRYRWAFCVTWQAVADIAAAIDDVGVTKDGEEARAELGDQSVAAVELQLFRADQFGERTAVLATSDRARGVGAPSTADARKGMARPMTDERRKEKSRGIRGLIRPATSAAAPPGGRLSSRDEWG